MAGNQLRLRPGQLRQSAFVRGRGWPQLVKVAVQPATPFYTRVTPGEFWERLIGLTFRLNCSAVAGTRNIAIQYQDGDGFVIAYLAAGGGVQANSVTQVYATIDAPQQIVAPTTLNGYGLQSAPAAGTTIASVNNVGAGEYLAEWIVELTGTPGAGDVDNFELTGVGGGVIARSVNLGAVGQWAQNQVNINVQASGTVAVKNIGLGTAGTIYSATLSLTQEALNFPLVRLPDMVMKSGWGHQLVIANAQAGDTIDLIGFHLERYPSSDIAELELDPITELIEMIRASG